MRTHVRNEILEVYEVKRKIPSFPQKQKLLFGVVSVFFCLGMKTHVRNEILEVYEVKRKIPSFPQ
jgi:hypothetical protein